MPRLFASLTLLATFALLSACSGASNPAASRVSAQNARFTSQTGGLSGSSQTQVGSRLSARQTGMQDAAEDEQNPEAQAAQDALIDAGSQADLDASPGDDDARGGGCGGSYEEELACQGAN